MVELPLCAHRARNIIREMPVLKRTCRDLGCRLILKCKILTFDGIFFFFSRFEKFVYTKMSIEAYLFKLTHSRIYQKSNTDNEY